MKKKIAEILLTVVSLFILFLVLETFARFFLKVPPSLGITNLNDPNDPAFHKVKPDMVQNGKIIAEKTPNEGFYVSSPTGYRLKKNVHGIIKNSQVSGNDVEISTNLLGFRGSEIEEKRKNDYRILVLGDSITLGDYVSENQTYPALVEKYLFEIYTNRNKARNFQVINAGVGGIDLQNEFAILMESGLSAKPDVVLVGLYLNDSYISPTIQVTRLKGWIKSSHFFRFVAHRLDRLKAFYGTQKLKHEYGITDYEEHKFRKFHKMATAVPPDCCRTDEEFNALIDQWFWDWGYAWTDDYWEKITTILSMMKDVAHDHGFKLAVIYFPVSYQVESPILRNEPQKRFEITMKKLSIPHMDLLPHLRDQYQKDKINLFFDHCHYRPEGFKFISRLIAKFLAEQVI